MVITICRGMLVPDLRFRLQLVGQAAAVQWFSKVSGKSLLSAVTV